MLLWVFISKFLSDTNFCLGSLTILVYLMINFINKIDHFTNSYGGRSNWYETALQYILFQHAFSGLRWVSKALALVWSTHVSFSKMHSNAENVFRYGMWQLGLKCLKLSNKLSKDAAKCFSLKRCHESRRVDNHC